ncbi:MFS transporter [Ktedonobacter racemifer]|uniref:General substrate transporter n=1 Tax=Ktedonobacter racemifer DSM 44963 TaxID=485913 RepID=D6TX89_KTERA|nr:MFS transporter [Ktedonobacter racemifer]EFH84822.1 General substrate transporter [Ktedonobacter racemifer DSM 44963]
METKTSHIAESRLLTKSVGFIAFVSAMGAFLDGYDNLVIGAVLLLLQPAWKLTAPQLGLISSAAFLGMALGGLIFGRLTDKIGRQTSFILDLSLFVIGGLVSAFASNISILLIGRFIAGLAIGADVPISTSLIAEFSPKNKRGFLTGLMQPFWFAGATVSGIVTIVFLLNGNQNAWRWALGLSAVIAVIVMLLRTRMPESPRWLLAKGQNVDQEEFSRKVDESSTSVPSSVDAESKVSVLFSKRYAVPLTVVLVFWFVSIYRGSSFNSYLPILLQTFGVHGNIAALEVNTVLYLIYAVVSFITALFLDRIGRRSIILTSWLINVVFTFAVAFVTGSQPILFVALILASTICNQIVTTALYPWSVEFFPTMLRGTAQGLATGISRFGAMFATFIFPILQVSLGWTWAVTVVSVVMFIGLIVGFILRPVATENRSLEEILGSESKLIGTEGEKA